MGNPERKFFAELLKGGARGLASATAESKLPGPIVNFVAKMCESGEGLIDDLLLTPIMKKKFDEKMNQKGENISRPKDEGESTELVVAEPTDPALTQKDSGFQW